MDGWIVEGFILPHPDGPHRIQRPHSSQFDSLVQHLGFRQALFNIPPDEKVVEDLLQHPQSAKYVLCIIYYPDLIRLRQDVVITLFWSS